MADYLGPYREMVGRVGAERFEALLWSSRETQIARFQAVIDMIDLTGRTVVDAGCGHADFAAFLADQGVTYGAYIGVDALPEMVTVARARGLPRAVFAQADFVADAAALRRIVAAADDRPGTVIVFSGSLNTLDQAAALPVLERAWQACTEALVFNFLCRDPRAPRHQRRWEAGSPVRKFDAPEMLRWAIERTPLVAYRQDYLAGADGTIVMRVR
jgi:SAM-dependent methyltransferase